MFSNSPWQYFNADASACLLTGSIQVPNTWDGKATTCSVGFVQVPLFAPFRELGFFAACELDCSDAMKAMPDNALG